MASRSGVNFQFRVGDRVLCFEPDPKKAKVLYEAKILETHAGRERNGARLPEYLIHFNGWSSSWDRRISEEHLLRLTADNVKLAKRLRDEARRIRSNNARKRKIDEILDQVFSRRKRRRLGGGVSRRQRGHAIGAGGDDDDGTQSSDTSGSTSDSSSDDSDDDGTLSADEDQSRSAASSGGAADSEEQDSQAAGSNGRIESAADRTSSSSSAVSSSSDDAGMAASSSRGRRPRGSGARRRRRQQPPARGEQATRAESNASGEQRSKKSAANGNDEDEDEDASGAVVYAAPPQSALRLELPMPPNLRKVLMTDYRQVHRKAAKPAALLDQPTVLAILERFLDHFARHAAVLPLASIAAGSELATSLSAKAPAVTGTAARDPLPPCAVTRMRLAEEVVEGVRVLFDCTLPLILLYAAERAQYEDIFVTCTMTLANAVAAVAGSLGTSPTKVGSDYETIDATATAAPATAAVPPLGQLTRPPISAGAAAAIQAAAHLPMHASEPRPQRRASHKSHASAAAATAESSSSSRDLGSEQRSRTRAETGNNQQQHTASVDHSAAAASAQHHSSADAVRSCGQHGSIITSDLAAAASTGEVAHSDLFTGTTPQLPPVGQPLLPDRYRTMQPPLPCSVYGLPHLLRLLLKLPDLVLRMQMTPEKSSSVQFVLQSLVRYLSEEAATLCLCSSPRR